MQIKTGIDIIYLPRFIKLSQDTEFILKVFTQKELENKSAQSLAGIFAAKEAIFKAINPKIKSWQQFEILHYKNGKPYIKKIADWHLDISISHDQDYIVASVVAIQA